MAGYLFKYFISKWHKELHKIINQPTILLILDAEFNPYFTIVIFTGQLIFSAILQNLAIFQFPLHY